jgi:hypothetical protein
LLQKGGLICATCIYWLMARVVLQTFNSIYLID